jgi:hypothetical protein
MSKAQKGNKENKKPKADKNQSKPMCRPTRRRKARASRPAARSRKRPDARFGLKQTAFEDRARQGAGRRHCLGRPLCQKVAFCAPLERVAIDRRAMRRRDARVAEEGVRLGAIIAICEARIAGHTLIGLRSPPRLSNKFARHKTPQALRRIDPIRRVPEHPRASSALLGVYGLFKFFQYHKVRLVRNTRIS